MIFAINYITNVFHILELPRTTQTTNDHACDMLKLKQQSTKFFDTLMTANVLSLKSCRRRQSKEISQCLSCAREFKYVKHISDVRI